MTIDFRNSIEYCYHFIKFLDAEIKKYDQRNIKKLQAYIVLDIINKATQSDNVISYENFDKVDINMFAKNDLLKVIIVAPKKERAYFKQTINDCLEKASRVKKSTSDCIILINCR